MKRSDTTPRTRILSTGADSHRAASSRFALETSKYSIRSASVGGGARAQSLNPLMFGCRIQEWTLFSSPTQQQSLVTQIKLALYGKAVTQATSAHGAKTPGCTRSCMLARVDTNINGGPVTLAL